MSKRILHGLQADNSDLFWGGGVMFLVCSEHPSGTAWTLQFRNPAYTLGPGTNDFAGPAARDAYFGAGGDGEDLLPQYNADRELLIEVGNSVQRRNAGGTAWENFAVAKWVSLPITIAAVSITKVELPHDIFFRLNGGNVGAIVYLSSALVDPAPAQGNAREDGYGQYDERPA